MQRSSWVVGGVPTPLLGVLFFACAGCPSRAPGPATTPASEPSRPPRPGAVGNPLDAVTPFARRMNNAMSAALRGAPLEKAFSPVRVGWRLKGLLAKLRQAGVCSARLLFLELELTFHPPAPAPVTLVKLGVTPWPSPALGEVRFQERDSPPFRPERTLARHVGVVAPLGRLARSVLREARAGRCGRLPLVRPADWHGLLPTRRDQARLARDTAAARRTLAPTCRRIVALAHHRVNLTLDDLSYGALGPSGRLLGMLRCDLDYQGTPPTLRIQSCVYFPDSARAICAAGNTT